MFYLKTILKRLIFTITLFLSLLSVFPAIIGLVFNISNFTILNLISILIISVFLVKIYQEIKDLIYI